MKNDDLWVELAVEFQTLGGESKKKIINFLFSFEKGKYSDYRIMRFPGPLQVSMSWCALKCKTV